ncbi:hypothetical protein CCACVL1_15996 [Corchorus capsularis]|uniref:Uncharacterized protein n=1 Tax=Corchorus capsularis TaxID=210143 RepID=A0A1R3I000_COCAP|nr:hypothetical protein CCACVL1_15996 [Corchorus capsularis]
MAAKSKRRDPVGKWAKGQLSIYVYRCLCLTLYSPRRQGPPTQAPQ